MPDIVLIKQRQSSREEKIEKPRFYVINLELSDFASEVYICPFCFISMYRQSIRSDIAIVDAYDCYNKLEKSKICTITRPLTKEVAETYLQPIQQAVARYNSKHNLDKFTSVINAITRAV